jgi:PAS domain S-box-containing protein
MVKNNASAEREREITIEFLRLVNESSGTRDLVRAAAIFFQQQSGCEAVGIRLREGEDFPYYEARGFPEEFVLAENSLCARDQANCVIRDSSGYPVMECMCGNVVCGRFNPAKRYFTERGSFWTNNTTELLATTTEADRLARTRNRCNGEGYESVALLPLRMGDQRLGLVQLNDRRKDLFALEAIKLWERLADQLAVALAKFRAEDTLRESEKKYKDLYQQLKESESKFRSLAEQSLVGTYIIQDELFKYVNPRFAEIFGYDAGELIEQKKLLDLVIPEDRRMVESTVRKRVSGESPDLHYDFRGLKKNGDLVHVEVFGSRTLYNGAPAIIGVILDVSEKKKLESQLLQSQKMEAVGQLTSGIAHDFNNILSAIIGYASLMRMKMSKDDPFRHYVEQILAGTDRAANLTRSLLTFSRKQLSNQMPVDVNALVTRVDKLLRSIIGEDIDLRLALSPEELIVNADAGQLEQILMNLATNARDAMPTGGILSIETTVVGADTAGLGPENGRQGTYALISVTDTGVGMDEKTKEKIFEPFYTTKDLGRGTGLGLSMVYGIIKQHHGYIHCYSEPRMGTTFKIYLPLLAAMETARPEKTAEVPAVNSLRGTETILVAEDDESLRALAKVALEGHGYSILTAVDGKDAVELFLKNRNKVRLVLCDVIMPRMSGNEVRAAIRKKKPEARFLFTSGYPADIIQQKSLLDEEGAEILLKPFSPVVLLRKVREALDR